MVLRDLLDESQDSLPLDTIREYHSLKLKFTYFQEFIEKPKLLILEKII